MEPANQVHVEICYLVAMQDLTEGVHQIETLIE